MKTFSLPLLSVLLLPLCATAADPKANEYKSGDCSGDLNYPHKNSYHVTMDDTSHCVYLAQPDWSVRTWQAYSEKTSNGGLCYGQVLGNLKPEKNNLDTAMKKRVKCVLNCSTLYGALRLDLCREIGTYVSKEKAGEWGELLLGD